MLHIILADTCHVGSDFARRQLGLSPDGSRGHDRVVVIFNDDDYMKLQGISREYSKVHDLVPWMPFPQVRSLLRTKGHLA